VGSWFSRFEAAVFIVGGTVPPFAELDRFNSAVMATGPQGLISPTPVLNEGVLNFV
jgi:hypothetical protein